MSVTGVMPASRAAVLGEIERLVHSDILQGSESLCKLLRYLGDQALDAPGGVIKEYQIATEVFGRSRDFDPRLDSTVRVQTGRLRAKLAEYYSGPGADDPLIIDLPKGGYVLHVRNRPAPEPAPPLSVIEVRSGGRPERHRYPEITWALGIVCGLLAIALGYLLIGKRQPAPAQASNGSPVLRALWGEFIDSNDRPWVVFSNAEFIGRPESGMKYFDANRDPRERILDHYTGVGEVIAIHELDELFSSFHHGIRVKRGRLLSIDDAKNTDIIFVGSPSENLALREIPTTQEFVFRVLDDGPRKGDLAVLNLKTRTGEEARYVASDEMPLKEDYAVIGIVPGMNPNVRVMLLAGTTTIGTQAAAEFVTREKDVEALVGRLGGVTNGRVPSFEAVLRVKVNKGVPVQADIVALHKH